MIKYTDEGLVTDEAQIVTAIYDTQTAYQQIAGLMIGTHAVTIPYPLVKEAIQPVEGELGISIHDYPRDSIFRGAFIRLHVWGDADLSWRALNISRDPDELRELVEHRKE